MATSGARSVLLEEHAIQIDSRASAPGSLSSLHLQEAVGSSTQDVEIITPYGPLHITVQGDRHKPAIVTCHDLGFDYCSSFSAFLSDPVVSGLSDAFCWYHMDIPGQEHDASRLPEDYTFPTMTQLSEQVEYMAHHFQLSSIIGLGVGCGADILARHATLCPDRVRGLVLVNCSLQASDWVSPTWLLGKMAVWQLRGGGRGDGFAPIVLSTLANHSIGPAASEEAMRVFKDSLFTRDQHNLSLLLRSYLSRSTIASEFSRSVRCSCLFVTSGNYQSRSELVSLISQLPVNQATLLEVPDTSGLVLCEEPGKVATALCYFLQGLGLIPTHSSPLLLTHKPSPLLSLQGQSFALHTAA